MHYRKWILIAALLASLVLGLVACGGDDEASPAQTEPTQAAQVQPTEEEQSQPADTEAPAVASPTPEPDETEVAKPEETEEAESEPEETESLDPGSLAPTTNLSSFRSSMRMVVTSTEDGEEVEQSMEFSFEYTSEPKAQHVVISGSAFGDEDAPSTIETYIVENTMYTKLGDEWMSFPASDTDFGSEGMLDPDDMIDDTCGWKKKERTEVNGVQSQHWTLSFADLKGCATAADLMGLGELTDAGGDLYVALEDAYVTQMDIFYEGEGLDLGLGETTEGQIVQRVDFHYAVTDANKPFTIELPEEAKASSAIPEDIPLPSDAEEVNNMFGMIVFTSPSKPEEVAEFYKTAMPDNGWNEESSSEMAGMFMLEFTKQGKSASLIINTDDSGKTSVMITVQES